MTTRWPLKRAFDLAVALPVLGLFLPLMAVVWTTVRVTLGSPVLFRQTRAGLGGRSFELLKFRTMRAKRPEDGPEASDDVRLSTVGRWLRATSLDELPQLLNVVRGDMSLVGPRPLLPEYLPLYSANHARRHEVPPGVTGWAQVNGRAALEWDERLDLDVWYVDHRNLWLDLTILLRTCWLVVARRDTTGPGNVPFTGSRWR